MGEDYMERSLTNNENNWDTEEIIRTALAEIDLALIDIQNKYLSFGSGK